MLYNIALLTGKKRFTSRDEEEYGMDNIVIHLKMLRQYWLCKTKPKQAFRSIRNASKNLLWNLEKFFNESFY